MDSEPISPNNSPNNPLESDESDIIETTEVDNVPTDVDQKNKMMELMKNPDAMNKWFAEKKNQFDTLPEDK